MMLTEEKAKLISDYLVADKERGQRLLEMSAEDAAKEMNADGCAVTSEDLVEFGSALSQVYGKEELSEDDLDNVAGGLGPVACYLIACGVVFVAGIVVGRIEKW